MADKSFIRGIQIGRESTPGTPIARPWVAPLPRPPEIGHYYARFDGTIRRVDAIRAGWPEPYLTGVSRRTTDPPGQWPGSWGAYLAVFQTNTVREVPEQEVLT